MTTNKRQYNGYMWKGVNDNWDWEDYYFKVFKNNRNCDVYVKYWNNDEMNEYVKLKPPYKWNEPKQPHEKDKWLGDWRVMIFQEEWKNNRYRCNYYLECKTPYNSVSKSEMKQIEDDKKLKEHNDWIERFKAHKQARKKLNKDRYTELKAKLNKTINNSRKNKNWSKCIEVYDKTDWNEEHKEQTYLFGKRFGSFIWIKNTFTECEDSSEYADYVPKYRKDYEEWKIYKIYERYVEYNPKTRQQHYKSNNFDKAYLRLKKIDEYIIPIRDINTHHKSLVYKNNKILINDIMETS